MRPATPAVDALLGRIAAEPQRDAVWWRGRSIPAGGLASEIASWRARLRDADLREGSVVAFVGDYTPATCALSLALLGARAVQIPLTRAAATDLGPLLDLAGAEAVVRFDADDGSVLERRRDISPDPLIARFRGTLHPGLVVFTSGSTGAPKGILHDGERVATKFVEPRPGWRTAMFLLMDHFGGFNTFLSTFAYGGVAICLPDRSPDAVCAAIEQAQATLLPTTPTFLNLLIASGAYRRYDLSSLRLVTYGTEVMPPATLAKATAIFPNAEFKQTYGLSELGVLRSRSESGDSTWVRVGGRGFETKVVDSVLWVRSEANMVGYLNAPSPFDDEGWMCTGDQVEVRGDLVRFLGRRSDVINVGGQKVFPVEVESVLLEAPNVRDATVFGAAHPLMGQVVQARVVLESAEDETALTERLRAHCVARLARYKVPLRFIVEERATSSERAKKLRPTATPPTPR